MSGTPKLLLGLLWFNSASAVGGGLALMTGAIPHQVVWVEHTGFTSLFFPGVILLAIVGGSSLIAALALMKRTVGWELASILAGVIMCVWIVGEMAAIRGFHFLQVIYLATGVLVIWFTPAAGQLTSAAREPRGRKRLAEPTRARPTSSTHSPMGRR